MESADAIIVGAGLAGLVAACELTSAGTPPWHSRQLGTGTGTAGLTGASR
ncbi:FAD-binding protein [Ventosimonas gracilis]|nr:FAD-binding protein [Ventosimonas gracilis]